ncbi:storkhead-box protein 2 [Brachionichthys hirsutus]|uniref:storkhead-box protein 2 n=1 Tax=Brachionichthys hirsutus TaxID=412623 RepID=UPI0036045159
MDTFLQIAPHSLAIVLSRVAAGEAAGPAGVSESSELQRHHTGYEIFADFKAENSQQHVWNQRITEAVAETLFLGWIDEHVLLIQGKEDHLEVLREGWMRRSLNPPRGFTIKYLGDVSSISMSPISQSQFIPLGDVLLLAVSAMNSAHKPVTQEALTEHLQTCYPGVPTPTEEVLHHTLTMLVRERKIYPTADGYVIVTPQTYFITPSLTRSSSKWYHVDERPPDRHQQQETQRTSPPSGAITLSTSGIVRDRAQKSSQNHSGGGGDSFFNSYRAEDPPSHQTTLQSRSPKDLREACSPSQTPPHQARGNTEKSRSALAFPFKADTATKHRVAAGGGGAVETDKQTGGGNGTGSRKFGLKLFRLSFKKDKSKQLATFSAQFPPEEWPLRDEETPSQLPRHIEMEIIRRINPDLTMENLARHTAVMKRLEEERVQRSKASSANQSSRSRRSGGRHRKPSQTKLGRSHSKTRGSRGETSDGFHLELTDRDYRAYSSSLARSPREQALAMDRQRARLHLAHSNPNILDSARVPVAPEWDVSGELAKRRTEIPFPEPSHGPTAQQSKVHRSHSHTQERRSRTQRSSKAKERSRSMDNSKGPLGPGLIGPCDYYDDRSRYYTDDGTLRANQSSCHYSRCSPPGDSLGLDAGRALENSKSRDAPKPLTTAVCPDEHFQSAGSSDTPLPAPGSLTRSSREGLQLGSTDRQADRQTPHPVENKGFKGGLPPTPLSIPDVPLPNGHPPHSASSGQEKRKEVFSKDTLFRPPPSLPLSGYSSLRTSQALVSSALSSSCDALHSQEAFGIPKPLVAAPPAAPQGTEPTSSAAESSFDYYNVSDDDELEEAGVKSRGDMKPGGGLVGMRGGGAGTMQWLLEREKERDLQRRFERTLTFTGAKANLAEPSQNRQASHAARLDSMDSSSVTVDSGFNSPRTRESLASNTSSIVESNRRQNLALSPGHLSVTTGNVPPFTFRSLPEPVSTQPEKLQKPSACLASITSV